jgi:predicted transposase YbfD/YdcC
LLRSEKVGTLPIGNSSDEVKQTNEIKYAPILLDQLSITDKDITADALHIQRELVNYLVEQRKAHYYFCGDRSKICVRFTLNIQHAVETAFKINT